MKYLLCHIPKDEWIEFQHECKLVGLSSAEALRRYIVAVTRFEADLVKEVNKKDLYGAEVPCED